MFLNLNEAEIADFSECHDGGGIVHCRTRFAEYNKLSGIRYIHDDIISPGVSIGLHAHTDDEEIYIILEGEAEMEDNGIVRIVKPGDICITSSGQSHSLRNTSNNDVRLMVINVKT